MAPLYEALRNGAHVALARDPKRRGLIIETTSTWRDVRWTGPHGTTKHRPFELVATTLTPNEIAETQRPVDYVSMLQELLDEECTLVTKDSQRYGNVLDDGRRQIVASRDHDGKWTVKCQICDIPNLIANGRLRNTTHIREIVSQAKRHVGAWRSLLGHRSVQQHWKKLAQRLGCKLEMPDLPQQATQRGPAIKKRKIVSIKGLLRTNGFCAQCKGVAAVAVSLCNDVSHGICEKHAKQTHGCASIADVLKFKCNLCPTPPAIGWWPHCGVCGKRHGLNNATGVVACAKCPRAYHSACLGIATVSKCPASAPWFDACGNWLCAACETVPADQGDELDTVSQLVFQQVSLQKFAMERASTWSPDEAARAILNALQRHDFGMRLLADISLDLPAKAIMSAVRQTMGKASSPAKRRMADQLAPLAEKCFSTFISHKGDGDHNLNPAKTVDTDAQLKMFPNDLSSTGENTAA